MLGKMCYDISELNSYNTSEVYIMGIGSIITGTILLLFSILIIFVVLFQQGHQANLSGAIAGGADTFLGKNQARTADIILAKITKFIAFAFFIMTFVCNIFTLLQK